uniref:IRS-type PTB domain-containing protein n=1 Tax=Acrobeloides nanus TaxID=290746 RepID=A0A914CCZ9_9BILA
MGNCASQDPSKLFQSENFENNPNAFRVFVKKKNKFIPGWLKISDEEILFSRGGGNFQLWPFAYLRRYGYTCAGIFFFESGRRCATGEGLHTFQSHQAERIFQLVQSRIKNLDFTRSSRASSVASSRLNSISYSSNNRIHPIQRFSSEGANGDHIVNQCAGIYYSFRDKREDVIRPERPRSMGTPVRNIIHQAQPSGSTCMDIMSRSYTGSGVQQWPSVPQIEGEIVSEHVLRGDKRYQAVCKNPISVKRKYHSYVNVDLSPAGGPLHRTTSCRDENSLINASAFSAYNRPPPSNIPRPNGSVSSGISPLLPNSTHTSQASSPAGDQFFAERYPVSAAESLSSNMSASMSATEEFFTPPRMNYAAVAVSDNPQSSKRGGSLSQQSNASASTISSPSVNYALIDFDKTKALVQQFTAAANRKATRELMWRRKNYNMRPN